jgi:hypothetical protein
MVRWSSRASDSIRAGGPIVGSPDLFTHSWVARPGLISGSPWPRLALVVLIGLPFAVVSTWALAWGNAFLGRVGVTLVAGLLCALALLAIHRWRLSMQRAALGTWPTLLWQGAWPGEPASVRATSLRPSPRRASHAPEAEPLPGFTWCDGVTAIYPRLVLSWGEHLCVDIPGQGWHWLSMGRTREDRAAKALLHSQRPSGNPLVAHGSVPHVSGAAGGASPAVASCESWEAAVVRRKQARKLADAARARQASDEPPDTFPPTAIMHKDPGDPLESSAAHGPA